jgi:hypothetical protein
MSSSIETKVVAVLMKKHGRTFSSELGIKMESASPSALFRWLCASLLFSARISHEIATVPKNDFPRLVAALVRCRLSKDSKGVLAAARES